jgi:hypothetical protein
MSDQAVKATAATMAAHDVLLGAPPRYYHSGLPSVLRVRVEKAAHPPVARFHQGFAEHYVAAYSMMTKKGVGSRW